MDRRRFLLTSLAGAVAAPLAAEAQSAEKVYRIGFIGNGNPRSNDNLRGALLEGLREFAWVEGKNLSLVDCV